MDPFEVKPERVAAAQRIVVEKVKQLNDPEVMTIMILSELNFYDYVRYNEDGNLEFDLTDMQWVAFAASLAAVVETGGFFTSAPLERNRVGVRVQRVEYPPREAVFAVPDATPNSL